MHVKAKPSSQLEGREFDHIIVGSGAAGATAALALTSRGDSVLVVEEGKFFASKDFRPDVYSSTAQFFRYQGFQATSGDSAIPILEGSTVGGTTVMNGAIFHPLPQKKIDAWISNDPSLKFTLDSDKLQTYAKHISSELKVQSNIDVSVKTPVVSYLQDKQWHFQAMIRSAPDCKKSGRCLQGCPTGGKWSMEKSFIPRALEKGAKLLYEARALKIVFENKKAKKLIVALKGQKHILTARKSIWVACGTLQTPLLLQRSGIKNSHLGHHFQCHIGVGTLGRWKKETLHSLVGFSQGIEILEFQNQGFKIATQQLPEELVFSRTPLAHDELVQAQSDFEKTLGWMASIAASSEGTVTSKFFSGAPKILFQLNREDLSTAKKSLRILTEMLLDLGAYEVYPGVSGPSLPKAVQKKEDLSWLDEIPLSARSYWLSAGHLFGTCRISSSKDNGVVDPEFKVHDTDNLFVIDASVFPTTIGVNPQLSIMTLARRATDFI